MMQSTQMSASIAASLEEPETQAVDMDHLLHYTMGDENLAREVLGLFSTQGRIYLENLSETSDPKERKIAAHTLKGSAKGVGAHRVAGRAETLEGLAETGNEADWAEALSALKADFAQADAFIATFS